MSQRDGYQTLRDLGYKEMSPRHYYKHLGEEAEHNLDYKGAIANFNTAADLYYKEKSLTAARECQIKSAKCSIMIFEHKDAYKLYDQVARSYINNDLTKWSANGYYFHAILCLLNYSDLNTAYTRLVEYEDEFYLFNDSKQSRFLYDVIEAMREKNVSKFTEQVKNYPSKFEPLTTALLLRLKKMC